MRIILLLTTFLLSMSGIANATTYYVRTDGGDGSQCTGKSDAAYSGSGTAQACAWKNPLIALPASGSLRIAGGDTLIIGSGNYMIGSVMQSVPSGPTASTLTRILGKSCSAPAKLIGTGGIYSVLRLYGSSNVEVGCLEITDNSDCIYNYYDIAGRCDTSDGWARSGIHAYDSKNVWLHDVNVHGLGARGMIAGGLTDWTIDRVKLNKNGTAGFNGIADAGGSNSGYLVWRNVEISWNGCGERVATGAAWGCWAQKNGGYGDGFGSTATGGQWVLEDTYVHHNTSDGLDFLYMDGADNSKVTLRRVLSVANSGNQVKITGNSLIENSVFIGHCSYFKGKFASMIDGDYCRAYGATLLLNMTGNDTAIVRHNTITGEGDAPITYSNGDSSDKIYIQNNLVVGFPYFYSPYGFRSFSAGGAPAVKTFSGNLGWNVASCPSGTICNTQNPKLTDMNLATFNALPLAGSPVIDKAPVISAVITDYRNQRRPSGVAPDIGAYEIQVGTPSPSPSYTYSWSVSAYGSCSATACGTSGTQTRSVTCKRSDGVIVADSYCSVVAKPATSQSCSAPACTTSFSIISGPSTSDITTSSVLISWSLSNYGTGQVQYGTTTAYGKLSTPETSFSFKAHTQTLSGLSAGTIYHYRVVSKNSAGVQVVSADKTFTTVSQAPVIISGPTASDITASSVLISWSLSSVATGQVQYGLTTSYGSVSTPETSFSFSAHTQTISGLSAGKVYHYRVVSKNSAGYTVYSADKTFTTLNPAPIITSGPTATSITRSSALISWSLSEYATGQVQYGTTTAYGKLSTPETSFSFKAHTQTISGLLAGTIYHYRVISKNANGAQVISADKIFTTLP